MDKQPQRVFTYKIELSQGARPAEARGAAGGGRERAEGQRSAEAAERRGREGGGRSPPTALLTESEVERRTSAEEVFKMDTKASVYDNFSKNRKLAAREIGALGSEEETPQTQRSQTLEVYRDYSRNVGRLDMNTQRQSQNQTLSRDRLYKLTPCLAYDPDGGHKTPQLWSSQLLKTTTQEAVLSAVDEVQGNLQKVLMNLREVDTTLSSKDRSQSIKNRSQSLNKVFKSLRAKEAYTGLEQAPHSPLPSAALLHNHLSEGAKLYRETAEKRASPEISSPQIEIPGKDTVCAPKAPKSPSHLKVLRLTTNTSGCANAPKILTDKALKLKDLKRPKFPIDDRQKPRIRDEISGSQWLLRPLADRTQRLQTTMGSDGETSGDLAKSMKRRVSSLAKQKSRWAVNCREKSSERHPVLETEMEEDEFQLPVRVGSSSQSKRPKDSACVPDSSRVCDQRTAPVTHKFKSHKSYLKNLATVLKPMTKRDRAPQKSKTNIALDKGVAEGSGDDRAAPPLLTPTTKPLQSKFAGVFGRSRNVGSLKTASFSSAFQRKLFPNSSKVVGG